MLDSCKKLIAEARQTVQEITWKELAKETGKNCFTVDVREPEEFASGTVAGAINVPRGLLEFSIQSHPQLEHFDIDELLNARLFLFCGTGGRSALAALALEKLGFTHVFSVRGGLNLRG